MQIIYFTMFMVSLIVYLVLGIPASELEFKADRDVAAAHMISWHKAAAVYCDSNPCAGAVDPRPHMVPSMAAGAAFVAGRFSTRYDAATKILVTNVNEAAIASTGLSFQVFMSGLAATVEGNSSMIGTYEKPSGRLIFTDVSTLFDTKGYLDVPPSIGNPIPNGSPLIVSRL